MGRKWKDHQNGIKVSKLGNCDTHYLVLIFVSTLPVFLTSIPSFPYTLLLPNFPLSQFPSSRCACRQKYLSFHSVINVDTVALI